MGTQQQDNSTRKQPNQQQQGSGKQSSSPRSDGEIGRGGQDAGTIGSSSERDNRQQREDRDKSR